MVECLSRHTDPYVQLALWQRKHKSKLNPTLVKPKPKVQTRETSATKDTYRDPVPNRTD